ncbi:MAG TPA: glycosyltransferase family 4 protein, partial [Verrucomicrobiae bacterium]|nr:glycosyltransferase family 4 protein [Verrucomicrobiae bacterium]
VEVLRVPLYPSHDRSSLRRVLNYCSFGLSAGMLGPFVVRQPDIAYVMHPPATIGLPALLLRYLRGIPFVLDIQDLWPDTLSATGMIKNPFALNLVGQWCQLTYRAAAGIAVLSPGFKQLLVQRGVPDKKIQVIYNWCDEENVTTPSPLEPAEEAVFRDKFNLVFAGNLGSAQALEAVVDAATLLAPELPTLQFIFIGNGIAKAALETKVKQRGLPNVRFLPRRPVEQVGAALARADALLVHLKDDPLFRIAVPGKTQAYLAVGKPLLMAVPGDAAELVTRARAGVLAEPENAESIASGARQLFRMTPAERASLGANGKAFYKEHLSLHRGLVEFERFFQNIVSAKKQ